MQAQSKIKEKNRQKYLLIVPATSVQSKIGMRILSMTTAYNGMYVLKLR